MLLAVFLIIGLFFMAIIIPLIILQGELLPCIVKITLGAVVFTTCIFGMIFSPKLCVWLGQNDIKYSTKKMEYTDFIKMVSSHSKITTTTARTQYVMVKEPEGFNHWYTYLYGLPEDTYEVSEIE